ncbi:MAG TPA: type II toxin-antitoxin system HicB family antitoxin [Spirochaetota bacterium]|nr:type II toxin-antitoxin system HicB family antitoxin [Spirochaetota bacterium]HOS32513.1 type II toxin-antitoxin system HicB family antitoxin [Spirochaetota bacterium]HOS56031.1 type II toxin-antitoxin system HicB family antitoxin [Spirochaetota bacterium]HPK62584.1 type II toxin-antitoxin system HicB family antitoxin [Spirochaetota bacterium]HQF76756.1 type II toxin-antitoxin system HicB family antitoxin [Spirochaetota bacterium]
MGKIKYVYWNDKDMWLGYLEEYPDYQTQGLSFEELVENLKDIYHDINSGEIPCIRKIGELLVS